MSEATVTVPLVEVSVTRGLEAMTKEVMAHEVDLLFAIHDNDNVQVLNEDAGDIEIEANADAEFQRLKRAYDTKSRQVVELVYRSPRELADTLGIQLGGRGRNTDPVTSEIHLGHKVKKSNTVAAKKSAKAE